MEDSLTNSNCQNNDKLTWTSPHFPSRRHSIKKVSDSEIAEYFLNRGSIYEIGKLYIANENRISESDSACIKKQRLNSTVDSIIEKLQSI